MTYRQIVDRFIQIYGGSADSVRVFDSPGRVNLIGEHTDYNGGYVFPAALTLSNVVVVRPNNENVIRLAVTSLPKRVTANIANLDSYRDLSWGNYQLGAAWALTTKSIPLVGCDMLFHGNVPYGGGLSSSASIEVVTIIAFAALAKAKLNIEERALLAQKAENEYVGVNCGIMDQFASAAGKKDHAILLDCATLNYELVPLNLGECELVLIDTNKPHKLADSKYNERRAECDSALVALKTRLPELKTLCQATPKQFEANIDLMPNEIVMRRARHAITENARTLKAVELLKNDNLAAFGQLMNASHVSLRDDFEVTGKELDCIFDLGHLLPGVLGIRMTGAGFGGSAVAIVKKEAIENFKKYVGQGFLDRIGHSPSFYACGIGDGGREIDLSVSQDLEQGNG